jgi:hypothetical protein
MSGDFVGFVIRSIDVAEYRKSFNSMSYLGFAAACCLTHNNVIWHFCETYQT